MSLYDSDKPVKHYERPQIVSQFESASLSSFDTYIADPILLGYNS